jgi:RND family efflux transporter MFP subunit
MMAFPTPVRRRRTIGDSACGIVVPILVALTVAPGGCKEKTQNSMPSVVPVRTTTVTQQDMPKIRSAIGSLVASESATIAPEVSGTLVARYFKDGQDVSAGDLLALLDDRAQQANVASLRATLASDQWTWERTNELAEQGAASGSEVANAAFTLEMARANLQEAQVDLARYRITAPFTGRVAFRNVDIGDYLSTGSAIVTLVRDSVLYCDFTLPQSALSEVKTGQTFSLTTSAYPDKSFAGTVTAISPQMDEATRTVSVRGEVPNSNRLLSSGQFAQVKLTVGAFKDVLVIPQSAIVYTSRTPTVFIVEKSTARSVPIEILQMRGDQAIIANTDEQRDVAIADIIHDIDAARVKTAAELRVVGGAAIQKKVDTLRKSGASERRIAFVKKRGASLLEGKLAKMQSSDGSESDAAKKAIAVASKEATVQIKGGDMIVISGQQKLKNNATVSDYDAIGSTKDSPDTSSTPSPSSGAKTKSAAKTPDSTP